MKSLFFLVLVTASFYAAAQEQPQYTQYTFNELLVNPAVTGLESYWDLKAGYRSQWTGLQGAPVTSYITLSVPLNQAFTLNDYSQMIRNDDNPYSLKDAVSYASSINHSGLGLAIIADKSGLFSQTHVDCSYAYHIRVTSRFNIASGISFGINHSLLDVNNLKLSNPQDPLINDGNTNSNKLKPEIALGIWCYAASFFAGASVQQLLPQTINGTTSSDNVISAQYFLTLGVKIYLADDMTLLPSLMVKPKNGSPLVYDLNSKLAFSNKFWIGGAYRKNDAVSASLGFNLGAFLNLGYAYEYTTSELNAVSHGTHEIMIGLFLNNNYNTTSPRHSW
jgi:type IX secretion system PorP/SprF family membrane protein